MAPVLGRNSSCESRVVRVARVSAPSALEGYASRLQNAERACGGRGGPVGRLSQEKRSTTIVAQSGEYMVGVSSRRLAGGLGWRRCTRWGSEAARALAERIKEFGAGARALISEARSAGLCSKPPSTLANKLYPSLHFQGTTKSLLT